MGVDISLIKQLRETTGAGIIDCKEALKEASGNLDLAIEILRKKGLSALKKREGRVAKEGIIDAYIHSGGKIGVLIEVNCETDFVARSSEFKEFAHNLAMQIAASNPLYITRDDVPPEIIKKEKEIYIEEALRMGKSQEIAEKIASGKIEKFFESVCLLDQVYIKDLDIKVKDYLGEMAAKLGENIVIRRFVRYFLGEVSEL